MLPNIQKSNPVVLLAAVILLLSTLFSGSLLAAHALPAFSATYAIKKFGIQVAEAQYQLSHTKTGYKFTQNTRLHGFASLFRDDSINAVSYIDKVGDELLLQKHDYVQTGKEKNKNEAFSIQWDTSNKPTTGKISGIVRSKNINLNTDTAVWDVLSFQIPLMIEASKNKKKYRYNALLKGEIDTYNFVLTSSKYITFSDKEYQALQMVRIDPHKDRQLHIWIAPELHNMPVIIENYRDGKEHSIMQLKSVQFNNSRRLTDQAENLDDDF